MRVSTAVIVGSDPYCARILEFALNRRRLNVIRASRALGLQGLLTAFRPDLVLLEHDMPEVDCAGVVRFLRGRPETEGARVLVYSRSGEAAPDSMRLRSGADGHLAVSREVAATERELSPWLPAQA